MVQESESITFYFFGFSIAKIAGYGIVLVNEKKKHWVMVFVGKVTIIDNAKYPCSSKTKRKPKHIVSTCEAYLVLARDLQCSRKECRYR